MAHTSGECTESGVRRRVIEHRGQDARSPEELPGATDGKTGGLMRQVVLERRKAGKEDRNLENRAEGETVLLVNALRRAKVRANADEHHGGLAPAGRQENRTHDRGQKRNVPSPVDPEPLDFRAIPGLGGGCLIGVGTTLDEEKNGRDRADVKGPVRKELQRPQERNAFEVAEQKRRITERGQ